MDAAAVLKTNGQDTTALNSEERIKLYNSRKGNLEGFYCPICNNKGFTFVIEEHFGVPYEMQVECGCMSKRRGQWRIERSGLADMVGRYTFDSFETKTKLQKTMFDMAQAFVRQGKGWFFVGGQVGSGKTHLCTAICSALMDRGKSARYMIWTEEVTKLKAIKMDEEEYSKEIAGWKRADVVYIDDLFKARNGTQPTDADINIAFEIINARYNEKDLVTIFSSERTISEILELDEALGSRIFQRCGNFKLSIGKDKAKNYRLQQ